MHTEARYQGERTPSLLRRARPGALRTVLAVAALAGSAETARPQEVAAASRITFGASGGLRERPGLEVLANAGLDAIRTDAPWQSAEPHAPTGEVHNYEWKGLDSVATRLASRRLRWYPVLDYSTTWGSSGDSPFEPPADHAQFAAYSQAFALRYGPSGSFWREQPELPYLPTDKMEIWNEANFKQFWRSDGPPSEFFGLYERSRAAIHEVRPDVTVVLGGLLDSDGLDAIGWLKRLVAERPDALEHVDALGFHPYRQSSRRIIRRIETLRAFMDASGGSKVPIEITEVGAFRGAIVSEQWGRSLAKTTIDLALSRCRVGSIMPYEMQTDARGPGANINPGGWYTLLDGDGQMTNVGSHYLRAVYKAKHGKLKRNELCRKRPGAKPGR